MVDFNQPFPKVGVAALIISGSQVLLIRRRGAHGAGRWAVPGGHLEYGESPAQCAVREALEETGLTISPPSFFALTNDVFAEEGKHYITLWMLAETFRGQASINAPEEVGEIGWFSWNKLPQPLFLPFKNLMEGNSFPPDAFNMLISSV